jgi:tryptophan-rich sensory protein
MNSRGKISSLAALAGFSLATIVAARRGARNSPAKRSKQWYASLDKPAFTPPQAVFPVVWTSLYALMAWSGWRIWKAEDSPERSRALRLWAAQLATNAKWSKLFFTEHRIDLALVDSIALELEIAKYISTAYKVDRAAAKAFIPYLAWVGFATLLNVEIARRNPQQGGKLLAAIDNFFPGAMRSSA